MRDRPTRGRRNITSLLFLESEDAEGGEGDVQTMASNLKRRASEAMIEHVADMLLFPTTTTASSWRKPRRDADMVCARNNILFADQLQRRRKDHLPG